MTQSDQGKTKEPVMVEQIPAENLFVGELNARMDVGDLTGLQLSIKENGVIEPLIVRRTAGPKFEIVAGRRRFEASKKANLKTLPCIVKDIADVPALVISLKENLDRQTMTVEEEGFQYQKLIDRLKTLDEVSKETGQTVERIKNGLNAYQASIKTGIAVKKYAPWQSGELALSKTQAQQVGRIITSYDVKRKLKSLGPEAQQTVHKKLGDAVLRVGQKKTWKLLQEFKKNPLQDIDQLAARIDTESEPLKVSVYIPARMAPALLKEAEKKGVATSQFVTSVVEDYLVGRGYKMPEIKS
jgi:ParB/RepB/Spo0J family partition protein